MTESPPECYYTGPGSVADGVFEKEPTKKFCGEWSNVSIQSGWTSLCACPSCPVKVAAMTAALRARKEKESR